MRRILKNMFTSISIRSLYFNNTSKQTCCFVYIVDLTTTNRSIYCILKFPWIWGVFSVIPMGAVFFSVSNDAVPPPPPSVYNTSPSSAASAAETAVMTCLVPGISLRTNDDSNGPINWALTRLWGPGTFSRLFSRNQLYCCKAVFMFNISRMLLHFRSYTRTDIVWKSVRTWTEKISPSC